KNKKSEKMDHIITTKNNNVKVITKENKILKEHAKYWEKIMSSKPTPNNIKPEWLENIKQINSEDNEHLTKEITIIELRDIIKSLPKKKAPEIDQIPYEILQNLDEYTLNKLLTLYNKILKQEKIPEIWKTNLMWLIHKKGPTNKTENY